ncbi:MAG: hypothetical protein II863_05405 [Kiritimatiellae bacterium]|nr:hypothetical protein [Kiritimatiellia bacterium]
MLSVKYTAPYDGGVDIITVCINGVSYDLEYYIVEPAEFSTKVVSTNIYAQIGQSGGFATRFRRRLLPLYVSFKNVEVMELPMISTDAVGYYAQEGKAGLLDHGAHGAGTWDAVDYINRTHDTAGIEVNDPPWLSGGSFTWPIPVVWRVAGNVSDTNNLCSTDQRFELDADGTSRVRKFGYVSERMTNGVFTITRE